MANRSANWIKAWAIIETKSDKLLLRNSEVPVYWLKTIAQNEADGYNNRSHEPCVHVEKVTINRVRD